MSRPSIRFVGFPIRRNLLESFKRRSLGTGSFAASVTSAPYLIRRLLASWTTSPFDAEQEDGSTFQRVAAARISISRAAAAASRNICQLPAKLKLPLVPSRLKSDPGEACT